MSFLSQVSRLKVGEVAQFVGKFKINPSLGVSKVLLLRSQTWQQKAKPSASIQVQSFLNEPLYSYIQSIFFLLDQPVFSICLRPSFLIYNETLVLLYTYIHHGRILMQRFTLLYYFRFQVPHTHAWVFGKMIVWRSLLTTKETVPHLPMWHSLNQSA